MRGKRTGCSVASWPVRIIPAHAGQTCTPRTSCDFPQDHPHACGANACMTGVIDNVDGSSPRMRGKRSRPKTVWPRSRIIPAHAGQTAPVRYDTAHLPDHPRACGANVITACGMVRRNGSSPRMRGKLDDLRDMLSRVRIIPAHAGQTAVSHATRGECPDHPRACGANSPILCENS